MYEEREHAVTPFKGSAVLTSAYISMRQHTPAYVSIRPRFLFFKGSAVLTSAYVSIRQHTSVDVRLQRQYEEREQAVTPPSPQGERAGCNASLGGGAGCNASLSSAFQGSSSKAALRLRQHTSAYVSICTSAYVSIRQHTSAYAQASSSA